MRVLLIDDSEIIRSKIIEMLQDIKNLEIVDTASNGYEGIQKFWNHRPDVVILDLKMPVMDGINVLQNIRTNEYPVKIIILTNYGNDYFKEVCLEKGADYFFDKNNDYEKVYDTCKILTEQFN